ncbi:hypothetical protein [Cellvibrio fibrivorans]|uniref:Phosphatase n=1 Tax=Cellvibrio fibrivorans TaxID=126350 RepID=A0ABU1V099_9GAMM|nr:hypothetical protein [Cellvibrio fibrivorans]MDR7090882.1 putative phosphatase [Cellvibrio fibrivorans]
MNIKNPLNTNWRLLSNLGQSKLVRSSYIWMIVIPVAAKVLENIAPEVELHIFNQVFNLTLILPFSWKALYFSSLLFACGTIIYQIFCPKIVKEYPTFKDFLESHQDSSFIISEAYKHFQYPQKYMDHTGLNVPQLLDQYQSLFQLYRVFTGNDALDAAKRLIERRKGATDTHPVDGYIQEALYEFKSESKEVLLADRGVQLAVFDYILENLSLEEAKKGAAFWFTWNNANVAKSKIRAICFLCYVLAFAFLGFVLVQNLLSVICA